MSNEVRELLDAWVTGWCLSRGITAERWRDGWLARVAADTRDIEYLLVDPSPSDLDAALGALHGRPDAWLTVVGPAPECAAQELDPVTHSERFMVAPLVAAGTPDRVALDVSGEVAVASITRDGVRAAWGQVAVTRDGFAVIDKIGTDPGFRRQGLASEIMRALTTWSATRSAATGLLFASAEGRHLYAALGWRAEADLATWRGRP